MPSRDTIDRAVILAAGFGSRLGGEGGLPKPLQSVAGAPLIERILRTLAGEGVRHAVVVVGFRGDVVRAALERIAIRGLAIEIVANPRFDGSNGLSVLAARSFIDRPCILSMADHLYAPEIVRRLGDADLPEGVCGLGVDRGIDRCFDLDDATKVKLDGDRIVAIGKDLARYDALDTGVFRIGPALVDEIARVDAERGDCSLSDGVRALAARGSFRGVDVGDARWIDVDTPSAAAEATRLLREHGDALGGRPTRAVASSRGARRPVQTALEP